MGGSSDDEQVVIEKLESRAKWLDEVQSLFKLADADGTGYLDEKKFTHFVADHNVQALLSKLGIEVESMSAAGLFCLLDFTGNGRIDEKEFTFALTGIHGHAKSIDIARL